MTTGPPRPPPPAPTGRDSRADPRATPPPDPAGQQPDGEGLPGVLRVTTGGQLDIDGQWLQARGRDFGPFATLDLDASADLEIQSHSSKPVVVICSVLRGRVEFGEAGFTDTYSTGDLTLLGALWPQPLRGRFVHCRCKLVALPVAAAEGLDALGSGLLPPAATGRGHWAARSWRRVVDAAEQLMTEPSMAGSTPVVDSLARLLATAAVAVFTGPGSPARQGRPPWPVTVERAVDFIESGPDLGIVLADISRAAQVSPRALQLSFRRHLGTSPMAYLRRVRLELARAALADAVPGDGTTVTAVAASWGFTQPGRFAASYRSAFAESPHDTLLRRPVSALSGAVAPSGLPTTTQFAWSGIRFRG